MAKIPLAINLGFNKDESLSISALECTNLFPHDSGLLGISGIATGTTAGSANDYCRGMHVMRDIPYCVHGNYLYQISYTVDAVGERAYSSSILSTTVVHGVDRVIMADNGEQLIIVAPDYNNQFNAWVYTVAGGLVQISDSDFDGPVNDVSYSFGFFNFSKVDENKFFISALRDGTSYSAIAYTVSQVDQNPIVRIFPANDIIFVFGSGTIETYQNLGLANFPYQSITGQTYNKGCFAKHSVAESDGIVMFIGGGKNEKPTILATNGGQPQSISTPAIDNEIFAGGFTAIENAFVNQWSERGHKFISWTVPDICTVVYDITTQKWHKRESRENSVAIPWRVSHIISAYSVWLVGDTENNSIGEMDSDTITEYGNEIVAYFTPQEIFNNGMPFSINSVELIMQTGIIELGQTPIVSVQLAKDFGYTYCPRIDRECGVTGQYYKRVVWPSLGRCDLTGKLKFTISSPMKRAFRGVIVDVTS